MQDSQPLTPSGKALWTWEFYVWRLLANLKRKDDTKRARRRRDATRWRLGQRETVTGKEKKQKVLNPELDHQGTAIFI